MRRVRSIGWLSRVLGRVLRFCDTRSGVHSLAAGDRWLIGLTTKATKDWLRTDLPVLDYANAMVPARQPTASAAMTNWQEHVDGKPPYSPPILPLAPAKFTGSLLGFMRGSGRCRRIRARRAKAQERRPWTFLSDAHPAGAVISVTTVQRSSSRR